LVDSILGKHSDIDNTSERPIDFGLLRKYQYSLEKFGFDEKSRIIDVDRIESGISSRSRSALFIVKDVVEALEAKVGKAVPIEDLATVAEEKGLESHEVEEAVERLRKSGDLLFHPFCRISLFHY